MDVACCLVDAKVRFTKIGTTWVTKLGPTLECLGHAFTCGDRVRCHCLQAWTSTQSDGIRKRKIAFHSTSHQLSHQHLSISVSASVTIVTIAITITSNDSSNIQQYNDTIIVVNNTRTDDANGNDDNFRNHLGS